MKRLVTALFSFIWINSFTQTIYIPVDYETIQEGIDNAADYDTIIVYPGTYYEKLMIQNKKIVLMSFSSIRQDARFIYETIIDGGGLSRCIYINNSEVIIDGFSVAHGLARYFDGFRVVDGVDDYFTFKGEFGGGIYCENSTLTIANTLIHSNVAFEPNISGAGGGVYMKSSSVNFNNTIIKNNKSRNGCGICCIDSDLNMFRCLLTNNKYYVTYGGEPSGDACTIANSFLSLINITITNNGNPILPGNGSYGEIINSIIWEELTTWKMYLTGINVEYSDLNFVSNQVSNINLDPLFDSSYHLTANSPCIDSGSPDYTDPDGTRSDMGAFYFSQIPVPNFHFTKENCEPPFLLKFTNTSKENDYGDTLKSFHWNFGDGTSSIEKEPQHIYSNPDKFLITLTATDLNDSTATIQKTVDLTYQIITDDTTLDVLDTIIIKAPGGFSGYSWSTGSEKRNTIFSARSYGTGEHKVFVEITDEFDCLYTDSISLIIKNDSNIQLGPRANFDYEQLTYDDSLYVIMFTCKSMMNDFNDKITEWSWSFGDETFSKEQNPIHNYYEDNVYTVILQVTDINDSTDTFQKSVEIISVFNNPIPGQSGKKIIISPNPNQGSFTIRWDETESDFLTLDLFNYDGQLVYKGSHYHDDHITLNNIKPGLYFIRIFSDGKQYLSKLVIE